ncbi:MAG: hypothetical protein LBM12_01725 [Candidatus Nomurabacteria bacterium]|jgi:hypothetical protein|nr:hypothetical protein [Candidatus Nomurabacteria bacterium]
MRALRCKIAKFALALGLVLFGATFANATLASQPTYAACAEMTTFLGLKPWWYGLRDESSDNCGLVNVATKVDASGNVTTGAGGKMSMVDFVWKVVFNVLEIILGLVAYSAVLFVVLGGFNILFSSGDPGKISKGKLMVAHAIIGVVVALVAGGFVRFINDSLISTGSGKYTIDPATGAITGSGGTAGTTDDAWLGAMGGFLKLAGVGAILMVAWGGVKLSMSSGDPAAAAKAKSTIIFALIGAVIMITAGLIVDAVVGVVGGT